MSKAFARASLLIFSLLWSGWSLALYVGQTLGDCRNDACFAIRDAQIAQIFWRWLAIELAALLIYLLNSRHRKN